MSPTQKLVIVLAVIAMLFVVALSLGVRAHSSDADSSPLLSAVKGFQGSRSVEVGDVTTSGCTVTGSVLVVLVGRQCTVTIPQVGRLSRPRSVKLNLIAGQGAEAHLVSGNVDGDKNKSIDLKIQLALNKAKELFLGAQEGTIDLTCKGFAPPCRITLGG